MKNTSTSTHRVRPAGKKTATGKEGKTGWTWMVFDHATLSHICPNYLVASVISDMTSRGSTLKKREPLSGGAHLDLPGIAISGRPMMRFKLTGLTLSVPCGDVGTLRALLAADTHFRPRRGTMCMGLRGDLVEVMYGKLKGFHRCLVLDEVMRNSLLAQMERRRPEAEKRADKFINEWRAKHGMSPVARRPQAPGAA